MNIEFKYDIKTKNRFVINLLLDNFIGIILSIPIFSFFIISFVNLKNRVTDDLFIFNLIYVLAVSISEIILVLTFIKNIIFEFNETSFSISENEINSIKTSIKLNEVEYFQVTNNKIILQDKNNSRIIVYSFINHYDELINIIKQKVQIKNKIHLFKNPQILLILNSIVLGLFLFLKVPLIVVLLGIILLPYYLFLIIDLIRDIIGRNLNILSLLTNIGIFVFVLIKTYNFLQVLLK